MRRVLPAALLLGCARGAPDSPAAGAALCPTAATVVEAAACQPEPGLGRSVDAPLEWGRGAASDSQLWLGRLACADGAVPQTHRLRIAGEAARSRAPRSSVPLPEDGRELLDEWSVRCPGAPEQTWIANAYRCGTLCPPGDFRLLPADAAVALEEARLALGSGDADAARTAAAAAVRAAPGFEVSHFTQGATLMALDDADGALAAFEAAAAINPENISGLYARIVLLRASGQPDEAHPLAAQLLAITPDHHPQRPAALCMAALSHHEQGRHSTAMAMAGQACAKGFDLCCELPAD